jgi:hypothetical protein
MMKYSKTKSKVYYSNNYRSSNTEKVTANVAHYVRGYAEFFVDLWLQEYGFQKFDSHTLAWAVVLASRRAVHFRKTWNYEFEYLFDWDQKQVELWYREIYKFYIASSLQGKSNTEPVSISNFE